MPIPVVAGPLPHMIAVCETHWFLTASDDWQVAVLLPMPAPIEYVPLKVAVVPKLVPSTVNGKPPLLGPLTRDPVAVAKCVIIGAL